MVSKSTYYEHRVLYRTAHVHASESDPGSEEAIHVSTAGCSQEEIYSDGEISNEESNRERYEDEDLDYFSEDDENSNDDASLSDMESTGRNIDNDMEEDAGNIEVI